MEEWWKIITVSSDPCLGLLVEQELLWLGYHRAVSLLDEEFVCKIQLGAFSIESL